MAYLVYPAQMLQHHFRGIAQTVTLEGFSPAYSARFIHTEINSSRAEDLGATVYCRVYEFICALIAYQQYVGRLLVAVKIGPAQCCSEV